MNKFIYGCCLLTTILIFSSCAETKQAKTPPAKNIRQRLKMQKEMSVDYKKYPKLKNYKLELRLMSHKTLIFDPKNATRKIPIEKFKYGKSFVFEHKDSPIFAFRLENRSKRPIKIIEWHKKHSNNIEIFYRNANSKAWIRDVPQTPKYNSRLSLTLMQHNFSFIDKKINFTKNVKPGIYYIYARLNLTSVKVESRRYKIIVK